MIDDRWMIIIINGCEIFLQSSSLSSSQSIITISFAGTVRDWSSFTALAHRYLIFMRLLSSNYTDSVSIYLKRYTYT